MTIAVTEKFRDDATETALIGAVVADPGIAGIVRAIVSTDDFGSSAHGVVWDVIASLEAAHSPVEVRTIAAELTRLEKINLATEAMPLDALPFMRVAVPRVEHYAKMVASNGRARRLARELHRQQLTLDAATSADAWADAATVALSAASTKRVAGRRRKLMDVAFEYSAHLAEVVKNRGKLIGLSTGIADLDRMTGGMRDEHLIILAGRPGMGKTSLGMKIGTHVARRLQKRVVVFSLEMGDLELWERMVCDEASIDSTLIHRGEIDDGHHDKLDDAAANLANIPLTIIDQGGMRVEDIRGECLSMRAGDGLDLVVIDALGLMEHGRRGSENEATTIGNTTKRLKALAKELRVPIVLLCQLSRKCEDRTDKRPMQSDLRDSGHIEQDADGVWLVYRDEVYNGTIENDVPKVDKRGNAIMDTRGRPVLSQRANKNRAEVIVAKQRGGRTGTVYVQFDAQFTRFANLEREVLPADVPASYPSEQYEHWNEAGEGE